MNQSAKYFFRGLLILLPVVITGYVVYTVFIWVNPMFKWIGAQVQQEPGSGVITSLLGIAASITVITFVGMLASNFLGSLIVSWMEKIVERLPLIKLLYNSVKDLLSAFVGDKKSFDSPVIVSLSEDGNAKVVGFVTRRDLDFLGMKDHVAVYLPQSYNFAGNLIIFPSDQVKPVPTGSGDVMTFLVSGGVSGKEPD